MLITTIVQSLLPPKPGAPDPWPQVVQRFENSGLTPDFVLLNECLDWAADDDRLLRRARKDLGLSSLPLAVSASGLATVVLYRSETVGQPVAFRPPTDSDPGILHQDATGRSLHGWSIGWWQVGLPQPLAVCSFKLTPFSVDAARIEAAYVASHIYRQGAYALGGGDTNFSPAHPDNPPPDWTRQYPYNLGSRAIAGTARSAHPVADRSVAQQLADKGLDDVAWEWARASGDRCVLRPTSEFDRIDTCHVTPALTPAITGYHTLTNPDGASDHDAVAFTLDTDLAVTGSEFDWR
ncbi:MAG TPA: hypothetical protein VGX23_18930 [Actinocrinis sp.]|nr:hypothetical protein [Actinocrinis sp.]